MGGFAVGSVLSNWYLAFFVAVFAGGAAPFIAGLLCRRLFGIPKRPGLAVVWIAAGCGLAVALSMLSGQRGQPEGWMGLSFYTSVGAVFFVAFLFAAIEHRLN